MIALTPERTSSTQQFKLWLVMIDTNCGHGDPDWEPDTEPEPLLNATLHAASLRAKGWIVKVVEA